MVNGPHQIPHFRIGVEEVGLNWGKGFHADHHPAAAGCLTAGLQALDGKPPRCLPGHAR